MPPIAKPVASLSENDLRAHAVWRFDLSEEHDETYVRPVKSVPVTSLLGKVVAAQVLLANGDRVWATIGNVDVGNAKLTEHFLTLSVLKGGQWFTLARYHDFDRTENGPEALANFLQLPIEDVFPISYDIRQVSTGSPNALKGQVTREPSERLTRAQIVALAVP